MIQRSGSSARSFAPISAATARTCSTLALSSVSGIVKNWGAWGSMAPPTTVDLIDDLLAANVTPNPRWNKQAIGPNPCGSGLIPQVPAGHVGPGCYER